MDDLVLTEERVRRILHDRGMSQLELADQTKLGKSTIDRFFKGQYTVKTLRAIERELGIDLTSGGSGGAKIAAEQQGQYLRKKYEMYRGDGLAYLQRY